MVSPQSHLGDALNTRVPRHLYRLMESLVINVQFVSAVDKSVTGGFQREFNSLSRRRIALSSNIGSYCPRFSLKPGSSAGHA